MEFHISRAVREAAQVDDLLFSYTGNVVFANVAASRKLAEALNKTRGPDADPAGAFNAGALFAMGLIDELSHALVASYRKQIDPKVLSEAVRWFTAQTEPAKLERLLLTFTEQFPNVAVFRGQITAAKWLQGHHRRRPQPRGRARRTPAALDRQHQPRVQALPAALRRRGPEAADRLPQRHRRLPQLLLHAPAHSRRRSAPWSTRCARPSWPRPIPSSASSTSSAKDGRPTLATTSSASCSPSTSSAKKTSPSGCASIRPAPTSSATARPPGEAWASLAMSSSAGTSSSRKKYAPGYQAPLDEYEAFSADQAWMPNVVLMAKSTYVWLEQLSKKYLRHIYRLDQIPDEELHLLADPRHHRPLAHRPVGALHRLADHQAPARPSRRRRLRLLAQELRHRRRPRRLGSLRQPEASRRPRRPPPRQRHGPQPHGHRLALGHRASRLVHLIAGRAPSPPTASTAPTSPPTAASKSRSTTTTTTRPTPPSPSASATTPAARPATSTTATTAPPSPGTTPRSSTTPRPTSASTSSRPSCTSRASSPSSASTPPWCSPSATSSASGFRSPAPAAPSLRARKTPCRRRNSTR